MKEDSSFLKKRSKRLLLLRAFEDTGLGRIASIAQGLAVKQRAPTAALGQR
jgi:hypothetical protein